MAARTAVQISSALLRQVERAVRETVLESHRRQRHPPAQTPGQVSFFSMELEKAEAPAPQKNSPPPEKESLKPAGLSQTVLDEALRIGANDPSSRLRIIAEFMKDKPVEENVRFLQAHYKENGAGFYVGESKYSLWYDGAGMLISPGESAHGNFATALTWEQAAIRIRELLDAGEYASQLMVYRAWPFERGRVAEALVFLQRDIAEDAQDRYFPTLGKAFQDFLGHYDKLAKVKEWMEKPESLQRLVDECGAFLSAYAHDRELLRFHYHRTDEILQGLKDLQLEPIKFTAAEGFTPQRRLFISQDEIDKLLREDAGRHDYRIGVYQFFEQHPDKKEREKYLSGIHGVYSGFHGVNDNIVYTSKGVEFSHGDIVEPYAKVELKWGAVRKRIEELIKKDAFLSAEDKEVLEGRYLEGPAADGQEATAAPTVRDLYQQYKPMVLAAVMEDTAYRNACRNSDEASARLECDAAIKRVAASASNLQFAKLYYDMQGFHARLHRDIWDETYPALSADKQETKPRYQVVVYHHFENGFDEKLDYPTLAEAEKAARRHLDGSMEEDGFQYEGAAVYDLQEKKWLRVFGHFPDEKAQEQVKTTPSAKAVPEQAPPTAEEKAPAPQEQESAPTPSLSIDPSRPYIFCEWSESEVFQDKTSYSLAEFDRLMKETDSHYVKKQAEGIEKYGSWQAVYAADDPEYGPYLGYDKVKFTLRMPDGSSYTERQDIGDGDGGVIDFLSQYEKYRDIVPILREAVRQERETPAAPPSPEEKGPVRDPDGWLVSAEDPAVQNHFPAPVQATGSGGQEKPAPAPNFRITDENLGVGGPKAHYKMNVEAIRLLRQLQTENRQATPAEQNTLSKYVGWGGLADAFDESKPAWASEYKELKGLLPPEEYESARASTLNSHYTTPVVIRAMYQALENMGFRGGRILEPSMGTGNFFGCLPESMAKSRLYGVELDSITGQIARQLYPQADIKIAGFETTSRHDFYDLAIGNVPFGQYQVHDPAYNRLGFSIHNYFFAKALGQVRPGGIVAFLTSRYTLDSRDTKVREYLAQHADLLGAVRLPNNTFKDNAGTEVVSDILFLQKRESPPEQEPAWVQTGESALGFRVNQYFLDNPHMVLGAEQSTSSQYGGQDYTVAPAPGADLAGQLAQAVTHIHGEYKEASPRQEEEKSVSLEDVKPYSFAVIDGEVYYREGESLEKPKLRGDAGERVKAMVSLRDCTRRLLRLQMEDAPDGEIRQAQGELNRFHHSFLERFGLINDRKNARAFDRDSSYYLLCSLEEVGKNGELKRRADIFTKRTIQPHRPVTHTETAAEALAVSLGERAKVDLPFMARLTGKAEEEIYQELKGDIFLNPLFGQGPGQEKYLSADEYLSGNVREKLEWARRSAKLYPDDYTVNVEALERVQPRPLTAAEIDVRLGAVWIEAAYIDQFMAEAFGLSPAAAMRTHAFYSAATGEWQVHGVHATALSERFGTTRKSAYETLEAVYSESGHRFAWTFLPGHSELLRELLHEGGTNGLLKLHGSITGGLIEY
ncbi:MAG: helicase SNF2, partial [Firmicutes bacterium]|nr:helicase SNF2 [Bacillota bacterium]